MDALGAGSVQEEIADRERVLLGVLSETGWDGIFLGGAYQNGCLKNHESLDISGFDSVFGRVLGSPNHWF